MPVKRLIVTVSVVRFCDNPDYDNLSDEEFAAHFEQRVQFAITPVAPFNSPDVTISSTWVPAEFPRV